ncbi:hypothetical protein B0H14DRAFT_3443063 [Mycena olivaceomarginata]|nr:hypothetical protein B0H14DRAFT_3443063 [Mycena olivaceomarginata]
MPTRSRSRSADSDHGTAPRGPLANIINLTQEIAPATPRTMRPGMNDVDGFSPQKTAKLPTSSIKLMPPAVRGNVAATIAIWLHSPDTQLQATGDTTHINYSAWLSEYLTQLVEGLCSQADWAEGLLNFIIFVIELNTRAGRTVYSSLVRSGWPIDTSPPLVPTPFTVVVPPLVILEQHRVQLSMAPRKNPGARPATVV